MDIEKTTLEEVLGDKERTDLLTPAARRLTIKDFCSLGLVFGSEEDKAKMREILDREELTKEFIQEMVENRIPKQCIC